MLVGWRQHWWSVTIIFGFCCKKDPLKNATVFADYNGDGVRNSNEPSVLTNDDGSYSINANDNFSSIVVTTNSNTIDTFTGNVLDGVTLKAPKGAGVVSPTSTTVVEVIFQLKKLLML